MITKGHLVAAALASLFATAGCGDGKKSVQTSAMVKCMGANACAGKGGCKTAANECAGKNGCKGHGFVELSEADCAKQGGKPM